MALALVLCFGIGFATGLRSMTGPAVVAVSAHLGRLKLAGTSLAFMGSKWAAGLFVLFALGEFVADQLPSTPARTAPAGLSARIVMGGLTGACIALAHEAPAWGGALVGAIGAIAGAFAGYNARVGLVRSLKVRDIAIAIPEDVLAILIAAVVVSQ